MPQYSALRGDGAVRRTGARLEVERIDPVGARSTYSSARPPWAPVYGARCGYGSQYMPAHGRTLRRRISRFPNQACDWPPRPALVASRHRRVRSAASTAARRVYAYDFLSPDMLRSEGALLSTRRIVFGSASLMPHRVVCPLWVLCHEYRRSTRRYATVREMKEGPSGSAISC